MDKPKSKDKSEKKRLKRVKKVVDLTSYRQEKTEQRRREYERVLFNRVLGVYSFVEKSSLKLVEILDISYSGLLFREAMNEQPLRKGYKIAIRFYFTPSSYLRLVVDIRRAERRKRDGRDGMEYGCEIDKTTRSYEVMQRLVGFMHKYSELACQDPSPPMIWF